MCQSSGFYILLKERSQEPPFVTLLGGFLLPMLFRHSSKLQTKSRSLFSSRYDSAQDVISICKDMGTISHINHGCSLELFGSGVSTTNYLPSELNLICLFNGYDNFWAIFAGSTDASLLMFRR
jgi:hypothetical protein